MDRPVPENCTELWRDDDTPFAVNLTHVPVCLDLAAVLRHFGFPAVAASKVMAAAVTVFGRWITTCPNVAMNIDGKLDDAEPPLVLLYVVDTGMTVESARPADVAAARKFCVLQIAFHEHEDE